MRKQNWWSFIALIGSAVLVISLSGLSYARGAQAQAMYYTPTAEADGRILYTIKQGDTCTSVSLLNNISIDQLRILNNLDAECLLIPGGKLLLGTAAPQPTAGGPTATLSPLFPTPTPFQGTGKVCLVLFDDVNGNALAEEGEPAIADGAVSMTDALGKVSLTGSTSASIEEPLCFSDLYEGNYNISVAVPAGYNPTTRLDYVLALKAGDNATIDFGAQVSSQGKPVPVSEGGRSPLLGILGGVVILVGIFLAVYGRVLTRR